MFLMFLCQHGHICVKTRKVNVFVKPNEQCRVCSNIAMARKRTFRETRKEQLTHSLVHLVSYQLVNSSIYQLRQLFSKKFNIMSAFLSTNRSPCRKKSILAKVSFDAKRGSL